MYAIQVDEATPERTLHWQPVDAPIPAPDEVLVDVVATALNRADLMQRKGNYPPPPGVADIMGLEMAGRVAALGTEVTGWQVGDAVCALLPGGGYAEQVTVPAAMLMPIPTGWTFAQAAGLPEVFLTAHVNMFMEAALQPGERILVHGGASGVGTAAIQLAKAAGNPIYVTAGSEEKVQACRDLGAELAINYGTTDFVEAVRDATDGAGVDVIMDMVGADYFARNLELLRVRGRLVFIATLSGAETALNISALMGRRLRLIGSVLRPRPVVEKIAIKDDFLRRFGSGIEKGTIQPVIDRIFPIAQANEAQAHMAANRNIGKIILQVREE
ncbi:MAG: NAD(P)H-quinone oxidoreductase [Litorilinea sp.]